MLGEKNRARCLIYVCGSGRSKGLQRARRDVTKLRGVLSVEVNHITIMLSVEYDPEEVTIDQIRGAAEKPAVE